MNLTLMGFYVGGTALKAAFLGAPYTPSSNTIAYYPLTSTTTSNDQSGNGKNLTKVGTVQYGTYGGVNCAYTQNAHTNNTPVNYLYTTAIALPTNLTVSMWVQPSVNKNTVNTCWTFGSAKPNIYGLWIATYWNNGEICIGDFNGGLEKVWQQQGLSAGNWYNMICSKSGTTTTVYKNGGLVGSYTGVQSSIAQRFMLCDTYSSGGLTGYMSEVILENRAWSATDVANYYNGVKFIYGL